MPNTIIKQNVVIVMNLRIDDDFFFKLLYNAY